MTEPVIDNDFIIELQKTQKMLKDNEHLVSNLTPAKDSSLDIFNTFQTKLNRYYTKLEILLCKKIKFFRSKSAFFQLVKQNNYFIFEDFTITPEFTKNKDDALDSLIYSPFSINFFSLSFKDIFVKYFTGQKPIPVDNDELITILIIPINQRLEQNMKFCPLYIQQIFNEGFNHGSFYKNSPNDIFHTKIIDKMFENPHLFNILTYTQQMNAKKQDLERMKNCLHQNLIIEKGVFTNKEHFDLFPVQLKPISKEKNSLNFVSLVTFEKLLMCSKKIPFQIPEKLLKASFSDQIKYLLVDENDEHYSEQKVYFKDLQDDFNRPKFKDVLKASFKEIQFQITFCNFKKEAENVIDTLNLYLKVRDLNINNINIPNEIITKQSLFRIYLEDPQQYFNDLSSLFEKKETELGNSLDDSLDNNNNLLNTLSPTNSDPFFLATRLLSGSSLKEFKECRPELRNADRYFENRIECQRDGNTINVSQPLVDFYESDYEYFIEMANKFSDVFSSSKDPYSMMKDIDDTYKKIKNEIFNGDEIPDDEEKNFIINLFNFVRPPNILSTFVFIFDYLFSPKYKKDIFESEFIEKENKHYKTAEKVLKTYVLHVCQFNEDIFSISDLCRICKHGVELKLPRNEENLKKLAGIIARDKYEEQSYLLIFDNLLNRPLLKNEPTQFTFRVYQKKDEFADIWICNVTKLVDENFDILVYDDLNSLVESLENIYNKSND